jgi:hypothetical protein
MLSDPRGVLSVKLAHEMKGWKSIELTVRAEGTNYVLTNGRPPNFVNLYRYVETDCGERMLDSLLRSSPDRPGARSAAYCDGSKCANVIYRGERSQVQATIGRFFDIEERSGSSSRPMPFRFYYVGRTPLFEAVQKGKHLGEGSINGRKSQVFLFPKVRWAMATQNIVYDLDEETGIPIQVRSFLGNLNENDPDLTDPSWVWTALSVDQVEGFHMPLRSVHVLGRRRTGDPHSGKVQSLELTIESLHYNKTYAKETFWPVLQPGVSVMDGIKKTQYSVPGKAATDGSLAEEQTAANSLAPAMQPSDWSGWASTGSLALGSVLLLIGLGSWWRRH